MRRLSSQYGHWLLLVGSIAVFLLVSVTPAGAQIGNYEFNDSHFHLTNNIQEGPSIRDFLNMMGAKPDEWLCSVSLYSNSGTS